MKACVVFLIICGVNQVFSRSYGVKRDNICDDVEPGTLVIKDDSDSCGTFIACVGQVAQYFKCFNDKVYSNGTSVCLTCNENTDEFYEYENEGYGGKRTTKKKFTYKQTKRTKATTKKYGQTTKPPVTRSYPTAPPSSYTISIYSE